MKRLLSPLVLTLSLLAGTGVALGAAKTASSATQLFLDLGGSTLSLSSVSGIGFASKGSPTAKVAAASPLTPIEIEFQAQPDSEGVERARAYLSGEALSINASLKLTNHDNDVRQVIELGNASILQLRLPAANASDMKAAGEFAMLLQPERLSIGTGTGKLAGGGATKGKSVATSNFRVTLDSVAAPEIVSVLPGVVRRVGKELQISGLGVTLSEAELTSGVWSKRLSALLGSGKERSKETKAAEMTLRIEYLDPALSKTLMSVEYSGVGIEALEIPTLSAGSEAIVRATLRLSARDVQVK